MGKWNTPVALGVSILVSLLPQAAISRTPAHDGSRDFEFNVGTWRTHLTRLTQPLSGSQQATALDGTVSIRPIWGGTGLVEEVEADGPTGHWRGMTFFLYGRASHQWSQRFAGSSGQLQPTMFGRFARGRGELVAHDTYKGRAILVRGTWSIIKRDSHRYEEAYSADGGRSWETVIKADLIRIAPVAPPDFPPALDGSHAFDFDNGPWRTRRSRLAEPLTGSSKWTQAEGTTRVVPAWGGRASVAQYKGDGAAASPETISVRLFDPAARQWSLNFSTRGSGAWSTPMVGSFDGDRGEFYDLREYRGRMVLARYTFTRLSDTQTRSEQAFSDDGGRTWETNLVDRNERLPAAEAR